MAEEKIRVGIIGANAHYGWSMRAHLPALQAMPEIGLQANGDPLLLRLRALLLRHREGEP